MRLNELRGLPVIDPTTARKLGTVVDFQVDPGIGQVAALDVAGHADTTGERVLAERIRRVGHSAVILTARGGAAPATAVEVDERWLDSSSLAGLEVMDDDGDAVGRLTDARFNQDTLKIDVYLLRTNLAQRMLGRRDRILPARVQACSRELMLVAAGRVTDQPALALGEASPAELRTPLKTDDRLPAPSFEQVPDGKSVGAKSG